MQIVLASQSPRRKEILERAGFTPIVRVSGIPEERAPGESPREYVIRLARMKAEAVACGHGEIVLGADTIVVVGSEVLEKPRDFHDARRMLECLSGRLHTVTTGICLRSASVTLSDSEDTRVHFGVLGEIEIEEYVRSGEPMDKAGAYAIQGLASKFVERLEGCYFNVMGLPISLVYRRLKDIPELRPL